MTTIAYRHGIMASDSLLTSGDIRRGNGTKIFRAGSGALVGLIGSCGIEAIFLPWLDAGERRDDLPKLPDEYDLGALVAYPDGRVAVFNKHLLSQVVTADFYALGSGNEIALGAMAMGASAERAVIVASEFDLNTGGPIVTMRLHDAPLAQP